MTTTRIIRPDSAIKGVSGLSRSERAERQGKGEYPGYLQLGPRSKGLLEADHELWVAWRASVTAAKAQGLPPPPVPQWTIPPKLRPPRDRPPPSRRRKRAPLPRYRAREDDQTERD
jgi:hypothetical protein